MAHVDGLHVHGLPDGAAFGVHGGDAFEDFGRAALALLVDVEGVGFASDLLAHGAFVDNQAAEPKVRFAVLGVIRVHLHGESLEAFAVAFVDGALLGDVFFEVWHLATHNACNHVAHAVVVADFFVLVPSCGFAALGAPLAHLFGVFLAVGEEHSAAGAGDNLVSVEANGTVVAEVSGLLALVACAKTFGGVFDEERVVLFADGADFVDLGRGPVKVYEHHQTHVGVNLECLFEGDRVHVPCLVFGVDEHCLAVLVGDGVHGGVERHVAAEDLVALQCAGTCLGHAVQSFAGKLSAEVQRGGARRKRDGVLAAHLLGGEPFELVDVRADGAHPVGFVGLLHILDFVTVHGGARKPDFLLETRHKTAATSGLLQPKVPKFAQKREKYAKTAGN